MSVSHIVAKPLSISEIALEPLTEAHREGLEDAGREPRIWRYLPYDVFAGGYEKGFQYWFDTTLALERTHTEAIWAVRRLSDEGIVGTTRYLNISAHDKRVEIGGTWYTPEVWAGLVNPACKFLLMQYGFETLKLNRIELKTDERNERSQAAIARLGATREGVFRRHMVLPDGHIRDTIYFSVIAEEWPTVKEGLLARLATFEAACERSGI